MPEKNEETKKDSKGGPVKGKERKNENEKLDGTSMFENVTELRSSGVETRETEREETR